MTNEHSNNDYNTENFGEEHETCSSGQKLNQPIPIDLESSLIKITGDKEYVKDLSKKLGEGHYIWQGFVYDLVRRERVNCQGVDPEEVLKHVETCIESIRDLRIEGEYADNIRKLKEQFERGMSLAQQSEI